jgi:hypothetical protein
VTTELAHGLRVPPLVVWLAGAALEIAHIHTGATVIDEFASRFVYFYTGYLFAPRIFALAKEAQARPEAALAGLTIWGLVNGVLVFNGLAELALVSLGLGLLGAAAVVALAALLAKSDLFKPLRYCGENSIVIYLAFFLSMALTHGAAQDGLDHRCRDDLRAGDARRRGRRTGLVLGGLVDLPALPVRAAGPVLAGAEKAAGVAAGRVICVARIERSDIRATRRRISTARAARRVANWPPRC